jgi:hypothetical protein
MKRLLRTDLSLLNLLDVISNYHTAVSFAIVYLTKLHVLVLMILSAHKMSVVYNYCCHTERESKFCHGCSVFILHAKNSTS